ncbi:MULTISPECIES: hypothetical protein [Aminobacter]|uniref:hypothetical protein n=1 Tax=Aminobacter TaxID=31988 RepID=UPI000D37A0DB|nr:MULTISPECIES: hypothetical protein [Aminobacter]AWC25619.1 hypothetical protein CO731_05118 [Aminobacter sp. MSH1]CAI2936268.1 conserved protein of unknown function [Aminobacter niigataensis]
MSAAARQTDIVRDICRIETLMLVCALALEGSRELTEGPRDLAQDQIRSVLEYGAELLGNVAVDAERALPKKGLGA